MDKSHQTELRVLFLSLEVTSIQASKGNSSLDAEGEDYC